MMFATPRQSKRAQWSGKNLFTLNDSEINGGMAPKSGIGKRVIGARIRL